MNIVNLFSQVFSALKDMFSSVYIYQSLSAWHAFIGIIAIGIIASAFRFLFSLRGGDKD